MNGNLNLIIVVPALNEEKLLPGFIRSVYNQTQRPSEIIIVDNNSSDGTAELARNYGCTVLSCDTKGIGAARQVGINYILNEYRHTLNETIVVQLDCDEEITNPDFIKKVEESYLLDEKLMVTTGPLRYELKFGNNHKKVIETGKCFRKFFHMKTLVELFEDSGRCICDYLLSTGNHKFFVGGNTTYRANVFQLKNVYFPLDNSWESIVISVRIQQQISEHQIKFIKEQEVTTSVRSCTDHDGVITTKKLKNIRKIGYIKPYRSKNSLSPQRTVDNLIDTIDKETYKLSGNEYIERIICSKNQPILSKKCRIIPMLHASTLNIIPNKFVVIKSKLSENF